jgi:hypothetical protein
MMMAEQVLVDKRHLTLFEKCQLAYSYDKLVKCGNKASLCRQIGIDWDTYYHARRIIEMRYDQYKDIVGEQYTEKLEELKYKLSHEDERGTPEKNRIVYASKKLKVWEKEIKKIIGIPQTVKYFRYHGYSNMFIELTIKSKINKSFGEFSLLGQCLCCGSKLCECEPSQVGPLSHSVLNDSYRRLLDIDLADWMERDGFCVCGHKTEVHQIGWITEGDIIIPYECRDCDCYSNLSDYFLIVASLSNKTTGDCKK